MSEQKLMKDSLALPAIKRISKAFSEVEPSFDSELFEKASAQGLEKLELKQRVDHIIAVLERVLDRNFKKTAATLQKLPEVWDEGGDDDTKSVFAAWPVIDYIATAGIREPKLALACFEKLTSLFSAEFAIRPFIEQYPEICFQAFKRWLTHDDEHVRRLVSEGTRPRLPWGRQLSNYIQDPSPIIPLLDALRSDESLYVRRSVANNLNDIAKDHPDRTIDVCMRWQSDLEKSTTAPEQHARVSWVIKHATRTLVKQGHPKSFGLLGYTNDPDIRVDELTLSSSTVLLGEDLDFSVELKSLKAKQSIVVDYAVYFVKANGRFAKKVFKLKNCHLAKNESIRLVKSISFREISTRKYYPGEHVVAVQINGEEQVSAVFMVEPN